MTAEDKLKELYDKQYGVGFGWWGSERSKAAHIILNGGVTITAESIDLIADLVIERLRKED